MTKDELIVKQQLEIESLKERKRISEESNRKVLSMLYCIGGPLNDNKLNYTDRQLDIFVRIDDALNE